MKQAISLLGLALCLAALAACGGGEEPAAQSAAPAADTAADAGNSGNTGETAAAVEGDPAAMKAATGITADAIRGVIKELSDDKYEGRGPGSRGDEMARDYIVSELRNLGLQPGAGAGDWQQEFELVGITSDQPPEWTFRHGDDELVLKQSDQFIASSGVQTEHTSLENAEIVFVGYGIQAPEYDWDDFKGQDMSGKVLLIMNNDPSWDPELFGGETRLWYGRWDYKYLTAAKNGAVGAIIIHTTPSAGYPFQVVQTSWSGEQFELPAGDEPRSQVKAWVTEDAARALVGLAGMDLDKLREAADNRDFEPVPLGITTSLSMDVELHRVATANVLGLIPGSDPELADEVVIYTAHHDHLGIGEPDDTGDKIYNGAVDNASGVAEVLAIAKAFEALPEAPRRSVLVAMVAAEEQGLLGSKYYAEHPTFPAGKIAANINYDAGNVWGRTHDVTFVGLGKSSIDSIVEGIAKEQGRIVKPDQFPDRGYFYRSDQFSFARIGVPALYLDSGTDFVDRPEGWGSEQIDHYTNVNYHQPSDEYDPDWNLDGMVEDTRLGYWTGLAIANADEMPKWNPGDEFEAARRAAIAAARKASADDKPANTSD